MKKINNILFIVLILFLSSCQANKMFILVEPGRIEIDKIYSIENNSTWSQFQQKEYNFIFWTVNGYSLERIVFFRPIGDNESLYDHNSFFTRESKKRPTYNSNMNKFEIKEFFENCIIWSKEFTTFETTDIKNYKIADAEGVSFDIKAQNELGLNYKGFAIVGIKNKKLYSVYFIATEMEFYDRYKKEAKKIISSIKIL